MNMTPEKAIISDMIMAIMGVDKMAYVKPVGDDLGMSYIVFAADGTELAAFDTQDEALLSVKRHNLTPVSVH